VDSIKCKGSTKEGQGMENDATFTSLHSNVTDLLKHVSKREAIRTATKPAFSIDIKGCPVLL
jgi:hypothetical protein